MNEYNFIKHFLVEDVEVDQSADKEVTSSPVFDRLEDLINYAKDHGLIRVLQYILGQSIGEENAARFINQGVIDFRIYELSNYIGKIERETKRLIRDIISNHNYINLQDLQSVEIDNQTLDLSDMSVAEKIHTILQYAKDNIENSVDSRIIFNQFKTYHNTTNSTNVVENFMAYVDSVSYALEVLSDINRFYRPVTYNSYDRLKLAFDNFIGEGEFNDFLSLAFDPNIDLQTIRNYRNIINNTYRYKLETATYSEKNNLRSQYLLIAKFLDHSLSRWKKLDANELKASILSFNGFIDEFINNLMEQKDERFHTAYSENIKTLRDLNL